MILITPGAAPLLGRYRTGIIGLAVRTSSTKTRRGVPPAPTTRGWWRTAYGLLAAPLLRGAARLAALAHPEVRRGLWARRGWLARLSAGLAAGAARKRVRLLFHCASLGEFEQCRPLLEELRRRHGERLYLLTSFFSRTPLEHGRWRGLADQGFLAPLDGRGAARRLLETVRPDLLCFVKFDVWPLILWGAAAAGVPTALVSAAAHGASATANPLLRGFYRSVYGALDYVGAVSAADAAWLENLRPGVEIAGDTKFDAVLSRRAAVTEEPLRFADDGPTLVCGSTHPADEALLIPVLAEVRRRVPGLRLILAPHHVDDAHLEDIEARCAAAGLPSAERLSTIPDRRPRGRFVLVDTVGELFELYSLADAAYVGGGFHDKGLHNVLEPAVFSAALLYGPRISNSIEARELADEGRARRVEDGGELATALSELLSDPAAACGLGAAAADYCRARAGAAQHYAERLEGLLRLPARLQLGLEISPPPVRNVETERATAGVPTTEP